MLYAYSLVYSCVRAEMATLIFIRSFLLPYNVRWIPDGFSPIVVKQCPPDGTNFAGTPGPGSSGSHLQPSEFKARVFESAGINVPPQHYNRACTSGLLMLFDFCASCFRGGAAYIPMLVSFPIEGVGRVTKVSTHGEDVDRERGLER
jgi:hypothetical protein